MLSLQNKCAYEKDSVRYSLDINFLESEDKLI